MNPLRLPLLDTRFVAVLVVAVLACVVAALLGRRRRFLTVTLPVVVGATIVGVGLLAVVVDVPSRVHNGIPHSFYVWVALPVAMAALAVVGWASGTNRQRVGGVAGAVLLAVLAAVLINLHYGYEPTLGDVLGAPIDHEVSEGELRQTLNEPPTTVRSTTTTGSGTTAGSTESSSTTTTIIADPALPSTGSSTHGTVASLDIPATVSGFAHRPAFVWLPPRFFTPDRSSLSVVIMLAGAPGQPDNWLRGGNAGRTADAYAAQHGGLAPVMVFPDPNGSFTADTECVDGPQGQAETYLTVDVPAFIRNTLGITSDASHWAVGGLSEGGTCALVLSLRHPDLFRAFVDLSGDMRPNLGAADQTLQNLFGGSASEQAAHDPLTLLSRRRYTDVTGLFEVGSEDHVKLADAQQLVQAATAAGITARLVTPSGGHNFQFWRAAFADAFPWLADLVDTGLH
jgi:S-formylglutathione hydrolase FrmB